MFAKLDHAPSAGEAPEEMLAGQKGKLLLKDDGDHYFRIPRQQTLDLGRIIDAIARRVSG